MPMMFWRVTIRWRILRKRSGNGERGTSRLRLCGYPVCEGRGDGGGAAGGGDGAVLFGEEVAALDVSFCCDGSASVVLRQARMLREIGRLFARLPHLRGLRAGAPLSLSREAQGGVSSGVRGRDAHGRDVHCRMAVEHRDQPRRPPRPSLPRHLVLHATHLPQIPLQDMGVCV